MSALIAGRKAIRSAMAAPRPWRKPRVCRSSATSRSIWPSGRRAMPGGHPLRGIRRRARRSWPSRRSWRFGWSSWAEMRLTRRGLLIGGAAGGGLLVAWALTPRRFPLELPLREGEFAFGLWVTISQTGIVTVAVPQLEMGQGVSTLLAQVAAMELGADWRKVAAVPAPISGAYANAPLAADWAG